MKKITLFALFLSMGGSLFAQPKAAGSPEKIIFDEGKFFMNPEWSPMGDRIAFSSEKFNGLWVSDASGQNVKQVTLDAGAGFGFRWSSDGNTILARPVVLENGRTFHQVKLYDLNSGEENVLVDKTRSLQGLPVWTNGDQKIAVKVGDRREEFLTGKRNLKGVSSREKTVDFGGTLSSVSAEDQSLENVSFPEFEGRYIFNKTVSPNGEKIVFEVSGKGLYVSNVDGSDLKHIGKGEHPSWMPDNRYVVVVKVKDDGYVITQGDLFVVDTYTGEYSPLYSQSDVIALKPSVSPDGTKVLFNNPKDGAIYLLEIKN